MNEFPSRAVAQYSEMGVSISCSALCSETSYFFIHEVFPVKKESTTIGFDPGPSVYRAGTTTSCSKPEKFGYIS